MDILAHAASGSGVRIIRRITKVKKPRPRRHPLTGVRSFNGGVMRLAIMKIINAQSNSHGQTNRANRKIVHMANRLIVRPVRVPNIARAIWPPSN